MDNNKSLTTNNATLGLALLLLGLLFLMFNVLDLSSGPLIVAALGVGIAVLMVMLGRSSGWLAVPASVVTMVGLLLIYTSLFPGHSRIWAYAWTLLFGAAGMGILVSHYWSGRPQDTRFGRFLVQASLVAFVALGLFFELLIFSRGTLFGKLLWPAILILLGGYLFLRGRSGAPALGSGKPEKAVDFEPLKKPEGQAEDR